MANIQVQNGFVSIFSNLTGKKTPQRPKALMFTFWLKCTLAVIICDHTYVGVSPLAKLVVTKNIRNYPCKSITLEIQYINNQALIQTRGESKTEVKLTQHLIICKTIYNSKLKNRIYILLVRKLSLFKFKCLYSSKINLNSWKLTEKQNIYLIIYRRKFKFFFL